MWTLPAAIFAILTALAFLTGCRGDNSNPREMSTSAAPTPSPTILNPESKTVVPPPQRLRTPVAIPDDWLTFRETAGLVLRYPSDWYLGSESVGTEPGILFSFDPRSAPNVGTLPRGGIKIEVGRVSLEAPGIARRPEGAVDALLDGALGWEVVFEYEVLGLSHAVHVDHEGYRYYVVGYFAEPDADETVFLQILSTVRIE